MTKPEFRAQPAEGTLETVLIGDDGMGADRPRIASRRASPVASAVTRARASPTGVAVC